MFKIDIIYSKQFEVNRIVSTLREADWLKDNNYQVTLPKNLRASSEVIRVSADIEGIVEEEFNKDYYQKQEEFLIKDFEKYIFGATTEIAKTGLNALDKYKIYLTRYGSGGSYNLPDEIIINIDLAPKEDLFRIAIHEIVHLIIEPFVNLYHISHWSKERLVDLIVTQVLPESAAYQNLPINTDGIDNIFKNNYPQVEKIFRDVAQLDKEKGE